MVHSVPSWAESQSVRGGGSPCLTGPLEPAVTLQFHPDWPYQGRMVIEALAATGVYRSQFVTSISNGGLTAHPGGDRWRWESRLFAGRYEARPAEERPVYGA